MKSKKLLVTLFVLAGFLVFTACGPGNPNPFNPPLEAGQPEELRGSGRWVIVNPLGREKVGRFNPDYRDEDYGYEVTHTSIPTAPQHGVGQVVPSTAQDEWYYGKTYLNGWYHVCVSPPHLGCRWFTSEELTETSQPEPTPVTTETLTPIVPVKTPTPKCPIYIVKEGDSLGFIAKKFGTSVVQLSQDNDIENVEKIFIGQSLLICPRR